MTHLLLALVLAGNRNLFQYVEDKPLPKKKPAAVVAPVVVVEPPRIEVAQTEVQPPKSFDFPFRYIGTFGPEGNPIAVFVGESVVTVRVGDTFADGFVLRDIRGERVLVSRGDIVKPVLLAE